VVAFGATLGGGRAAAASGPDLTAGGASAKGGTVYVGDRLAVRATVANRGSGPAAKSIVAFYLSRDKSWSSADVLLGKAKVAKLRPRGKRSVSDRPTIPAAAPLLAKLQVLACADGAFKLIEGSEENNCAAARSKLVVADKTPFGAIDAALFARRINAEKALTYKLFAGFGDKRLPKAYDFKGDAPGGDLTAVTDQAVQDFDTLSPATQDAILPFLIPPAYEGSYAARRPGTRPSARATLDSCSVRSPQWTPVAVGVGAGTGAGGAVIWWNSARPGDEAAANRLAGELASQIWPRLTALMGTAPISDAGHSCSGIDGRLDIYLDPIPDPETSQFNSSCAPSASDIIFPANGSRGALAHEFMHVLQKTFSRLAPCQQFAYMDDATATWAEDYVYKGDHSEHHYPQMLQYPDIRFNFPPTAGYPAWVLFYSASKHLSPDVVPAFHTAAQNEPPLEALDSAMTLSDAWPQFARDGWNRSLPPALTESFFSSSWDSFGVKPDTQKKPYALTGHRKTFPLPIELLGMGRQYQWIDLSDGHAKLVTFIDPAPTEVDPNLHTYAFYKADGKWKGEDWTGRDQVEFCRETTDVREVVLVHSTTTPPAGAGGGDLAAKTDKAKLRLADKCDPNANFDVSSVSGSFDGTVHKNRPDPPPCSTELDAHFTSTLGSGAKPASLSVVDDTGDGPPILAFDGGQIPMNAHGTGTATETCSGGKGELNGTATCHIDVSSTEFLRVGSDQFATKPDPMKLGWSFAFPSELYDPGANSGEPRNCSESGSDPPSIGQAAYNPSIVVDEVFDPPDPDVDPTLGSGVSVPGKQSVPRATFGGDTITLSFSGSGTSQYDEGYRSMSAQWTYSMVVTFTRR
jgi:hypothetical protein